MLPTKKLILLAYYYLPDNTSGVQRAVRLAKYLPRFGVDTLVIASSHAGTDLGAPCVEHVPVEGNRAPSRQEKVARFAQRIAPYNERIEWVPHAIHAVRKAIAREHFDAVISTSPPLGTHLAALAIKRRYGLKWIADFRDPLSGNPGRSRRWAKPYDAWLERSVFRHADIVVAVTDTVAAAWKERYPHWAAKFQVVWNGFDPETALRPEVVPPRATRLVAHVGVLYSQRHPYRLSEGLTRLIQSGLLDPAAICLQFTGPVQDRERFESAAGVAELMRQGCLTIRDELIPRDEANREIATADFLLLIDIVNLSNVGYTVPAKLYDYVLTGRPILALTDRQSPVERILARSGVPYACLYHDDSDQNFDDKLRHFLTLPSAPSEPSSWFLETFDGRLQAGKLAAMLTAL